MKKIPRLIAFSLGLVLLSALSTTAFADEKPVQLNVTVLVASNQGNDFNLVNDEYRDQLINLFSYTSYNQVDIKALKLPRSERVKLELPEDYELVLTLQEEERNRIHVQTLVRKLDKQYVYSVLAITRPGVVFVGGPKLEDGSDLILVIESTGK